MMRLLVLFLLLAAPAPVHDDPQRPDEWERVVDLRGAWQFRLGDDLAWADPDVFDKDWETIFVPSRWEEEGYWGYDGYAWYRKRFRLPKETGGRSLYLDVGRIDDVSAVYVNGHFVGSAGRFPPDFQTAYHVFNRYRIPSEYLKAGGSNVVSIRVYDTGGEGGLLEGRPGLYVRLDEPAMVLDLSGLWRFRTGDRMAWRAVQTDEAGWDVVTVPGRWENQGFDDYDGFAWYRKAFKAPASHAQEDLVLLLGKIDDLDEVYLNGALIGATGRMRDRDVEGWEWQVVRAYPVPAGVLRYGAENVLAVRVWDGLVDGGIYEGPVGLVRKADVERWSAPGAPGKKAPRSAWKTFLDWLFDDGDIH